MNSMPKVLQSYSENFKTHVTTSGVPGSSDYTAVTVHQANAVKAPNGKLLSTVLPKDARAAIEAYQNVSFQTTSEIYQVLTVEDAGVSVPSIWTPEVAQV